MTLKIDKFKHLIHQSDTIALLLEGVVSIVICGRSTY